MTPAMTIFTMSHQASSRSEMASLRSEIAVSAVAWTRSSAIWVTPLSNVQAVTSAAVRSKVILRFSSRHRLSMDAGPIERFRRKEAFRFERRPRLLRYVKQCQRTWHNARANRRS